MFYKIFITIISLCLLCLIILTNLQQQQQPPNCWTTPSSSSSKNDPDYNYDYDPVDPGSNKTSWNGSQGQGRLKDSPQSSSGITSTFLNNSSIPSVAQPLREATRAKKGRLPIMGDRRGSGNSQGQISSRRDSVDGPYKGHFDIIQLNVHLKACVHGGQINMDEYILTFQQLYKFFCMLGTVFGFVGSDVKSKLEILQEHRNNENRTHYETIEMMVAFERSSDLINTNKETSGSRTFLRLHRALNFVIKFLSKMEEIGEDEGTYYPCKEAYKDTLSKYHPWLIQKGATIAMLALPLKKDLIQRVCDGRIQTSEVNILLPQVIQYTSQIYDKCETIYRENDILNLP